MQHGGDGKGMFALCGYRGWVSAAVEGDAICGQCQKIVNAHGGWNAVLDMEGLAVGQPA